MSNKPMPFSHRERERMAKQMTVQQILDTNNFQEDEPHRLVRKWKEIIHLWTVTRRPEYRWGSIENSLWQYGTTGITVHHFTAALLSEFDFADDLHMDAHLRYLYWSFDGGASNDADWREVLAAVSLPKFYKLIRLKPMELLVKIFDIFAKGGTTANCVPNDAWYIDSIEDMLKIFYAPCMTIQEKEMMLDGVTSTLQDFRIDLNPLQIEGSDKLRPKQDGWSYRCTRRAFKNMFRVPEEEKNTHRARTVNRFQSFAWDRLPVELHLSAFDEIQVEAMRISEKLTEKHQLRLALALYFKSLQRKIFKEWRIVAGSESYIRNFANRKVWQKRRIFFRFWRKLAIKKVVLRRKRILAEVMGNYVMKARYFARIKVIFRPPHHSSLAYEILTFVHFHSRPNSRSSTTPSASCFTSQPNSIPSTRRIGKVDITSESFSE